MLRGQFAHKKDQNLVSRDSPSELWAVHLCYASQAASFAQDLVNVTDNF